MPLGSIFPCPHCGRTAKVFDKVPTTLCAYQEARAELSKKQTLPVIEAS